MKLNTVYFPFLSSVSEASETNMENIELCIISMMSPHFVDPSLRVSLPIFSDHPQTSPSVLPLSSIRHENVTIRHSRQEKNKKGCWGNIVSEDQELYIPLSVRIKNATINVQKPSISFSNGALRAINAQEVVS